MPDINGNIEALDDLVEQMALLFKKSLSALEQNKESGLFIAERIYKIIQQQKIEMENLFNQNADI
jgi:hypothetical protein